MKQKLRVFLRLWGILALAAALCLTLINRAKDIQAGYRSETVTQQIRSAMASHKMTDVPSPETTSVRTQADQSAPPALKVEDSEYIGILDIPDCGLTLPVAAQLSCSALKTSPCRYSGSAHQGDLVIAAHNYTSHFACLSRLCAGDEIRFTDIYGHVFAYTVLSAETVSPDDIDAVTRGQWDLTLFTCTTGGNMRLAVHCERFDQSD